MILKAEDIAKYGVRVANDVSKELVNASIIDAELQVLKPIVGVDAFAKLIGLSIVEPNSPLLIGGEVTTSKGVDYIGGVMRAIANVAYAFIVQNRMQASAFGAVLKRSDQSENANVFEYAKASYDKGLNYIYELANAMGIDDENLGKSNFQKWSI